MAAVLAGRSVRTGARNAGTKKNNNKKRNSAPTTISYSLYQFAGGGGEVKKTKKTKKTKIGSVFLQAQTAWKVHSLCFKVRHNVMHS